MGNSLNADLTDKIVILNDMFKDPAMKGEENAYARAFHVGGGFGAKPYTTGNALMGEFVRDGEQCRQEGWQVTRYATPEEIEKAEAERVFFDDMSENYAFVRLYMRKEDIDGLKVLFNVIQTNWEPTHTSELKKLYDRYRREYSQ